MMNSLLNPTPQQIKHRNRLWSEALKKNKRKARAIMYDPKGGRCCLAVARDVAISCGLELGDIRPDNYPESSVIDFFGWNCNNAPSLRLPSGHFIEADEINDGAAAFVNAFPDLNKGISHAKIAECVLNTFVRPKNPKWSFKL